MNELIQYRRLSDGFIAHRAKPDKWLERSSRWERVQSLDQTPDKEGAPEGDATQEEE